MSFDSSHIIFQTIGDVLVIPLPPLIDHILLNKLEDQLLERLGKSINDGIVFDFHGVDVMDSLDIERFRSIVLAAQLMGVSSVLTGLSVTLIAGIIAIQAEMEWATISPSVEAAVKKFSCKRKKSE